MSEKMEFDYIVCGGGTSGCVVASRLAEDPNISVLLVEAGAESCLNVQASQMTGAMAQLIGSPHDWNFYSTPQPHANDRKISLTRGKFLGGSSGMNGTLCVRGTKQDYDDWDVPGWGGEEMFAAMKKAEKFHGKDWFDAVEDAHGYDGPVNIEPHDLAPISERILESLQHQGFPLDHDMFSTGSRSHGCGHAPRTVYKGLRQTAAEYTRGWESKPNFTILFNTLVDKANLTQTSTGLHATSLDLITPAGTKTVTARREIILSAGTYCTPTILLRSGIGPREELSKHSIPCQVNLPGVGHNLQDHLIVFTPYEVQPGYTTDNKIFPESALQASYTEWTEKKTGVLSTFPFGVFAFTRLDNRLKDVKEWQEARRGEGRDPIGLTKKQPHIEYFTTECCAGPRELPPANGKHAFAFITQLFSPHSRGTVTLSSPDPLADPVIDHAYLSDPSGLDLLVLTEGVRLGNKIIVNGKGTKDLILDSYPAESGHHKYKTREEWMDFVRQNATTCYHPVGTCKMSRDGDPMGVVDERLRVRGVRGLRIVDCSVMPTIPAAHTCMPAYGIGEKAAEILKENREPPCKS